MAVAGAREFGVRGRMQQGVRGRLQCVGGIRRMLVVAPLSQGQTGVEWPIISMGDSQQAELWPWLVHVSMASAVQDAAGAKRVPAV